jgi:hypothetical protein
MCDRKAQEEKEIHQGKGLNIGEERETREEKGNSREASKEDKE